jgi:hypothetical protein
MSRVKTAKRKTVDFVVTIDPCVCGSDKGTIEIEQEGTLQCTVVRCVGCRLEVDHTGQAVRG